MILFFLNLLFLSYVSSYCTNSEKMSAYNIQECTNSFRQTPYLYKDAINKVCNYDFSVEYPPRKTLIQSYQLEEVAQQQANAMSITNVFSHNVPGYGSLQDRWLLFNVVSNSGSENIAYGQYTPLDLLIAWFCSPPHREALYSCNYDSLGVATSYSISDGKWYSVQDFACFNNFTCNSCL